MHEQTETNKILNTEWVIHTIESSGPQIIIYNLNPDPDWLGNSLPLFIQFNSRSTDVRIRLHKFWPTPRFCKRLPSHWSRAGLLLDHPVVRLYGCKSPYRKWRDTQENGCWLPPSVHTYSWNSFADQIRTEEWLVKQVFCIVDIALGLVFLQYFITWTRSWTLDNIWFQFCDVKIFRWFETCCGYSIPLQSAGALLEETLWLILNQRRWEKLSD